MHNCNDKNREEIYLQLNAGDECDFSSFTKLKEISVISTEGQHSSKKVNLIGLSKLRNLSVLRLSGHFTDETIASINNMKTAKSIESLALIYTNLYDVSNFTNLKELTVYNQEIVGLKSNKKIEHLKLINVDFCDMRSIENFRNLRKLEIDYKQRGDFMGGLYVIEKIRNLPNLESLCIDTVCIEELILPKMLRELRLFNFKIDMKVINNLNNLRILSMDSFDPVININSLTKLNELSLVNCKERNKIEIYNLVDLKSINLEGSNISIDCCDNIDNIDIVGGYIYVD